MSTAVEELLLRPHQSRDIHGVHELIRQGKRRIVMVAPTGSGKRYCGVWWAQRAQRQGKEVLIVTDRRLLVKQMHDDLERFGVDYGVIMGEYEENRQPTVQVASIQSLDGRYVQKEGVGLPSANLIMDDECHKEGERLAKLLAHYPDAIVIGLTATPVGPQGRSLIGSTWEAIFEGTKNSQLIRDGLLLPTNVYAPSEPNIKGVTINGGQEFNQAKLSRAVRSVTLFGDMFNEWAPFADRKTIVFAPGIAFCNGLVGGPGIEGDSFYARGIPAAVIEARTKRRDREELFDRFENGDLRVLVSVDVLREGFDAPIASCGIDLQPNSQLRTYWQKVGRIKRPHPGQSEAVWIDMAGNCWRFPHPDEDPPWSEVTGDKTSQDVLEDARTRGRMPGCVICPKCKRQRKGGPTCPECGHQADPRQQVKFVRMGKGKLKEVRIEHKQKVQKTDYEKAAARWRAEIYAGYHGDKTLAQCKVSYKRKHGTWPPSGLPGMPAFESSDWKALASDIYPPSKIERMFREHQQQEG